MVTPVKFRYTESHEWIAAEGGAATVGITDHAQDALGDIVHVELPKVGARFKKGAKVAEVESVKAVSDIYSPASGTVVSVNEGLDGHEDTINKEPYEGGWLFKLELDDPSELASLLDAAGYDAVAGEH